MTGFWDLATAQPDRGLFDGCVWHGGGSCFCGGWRWGGGVSKDTGHVDMMEICTVCDFSCRDDVYATCPRYIRV